jgi:hypothetical protein
VLGKRPGKHFRALQEARQPLLSGGSQEVVVMDARPDSKPAWPGGGRGGGGSPVKMDVATCELLVLYCAVL